MTAIGISVFEQSVVRVQLQTLLDAIKTVWNDQEPSGWVGGEKRLANIELLFHLINHTRLSGELSAFVVGLDGEDPVSQEVKQFSTDLLLHALRFATGCGISAGDLLEILNQMASAEMIATLTESVRDHKL